MFVLFAELLEEERKKNGAAQDEASHAHTENGKRACMRGNHGGEGRGGKANRTDG
jgi:hypothetical protein